MAKILGRSLQRHNLSAGHRSTRQQLKKLYFSFLCLCISTSKAHFVCGAPSMSNSISLINACCILWFTQVKHQINKTASNVIHTSWQYLRFLLYFHLYFAGVQTKSTTIQCPTNCISRSLAPVRESKQNTLIT